MIGGLTAYGDNARYTNPPPRLFRPQKTSHRESSDLGEDGYPGKVEAP